MTESRYATTDLGKTIRDAGRTMRWIAKETGLSESYVYKIVSGIRPAPSSFADRLGAILGIPADTLFLPGESLSRNDSLRESEAAD